MRTTVTLDDDVVQKLRRRMKRDGVSFKTALNDAVRDSATARPSPRTFKTRTADPQSISTGRCRLPATWKTTN
jgi:hypothetical protein